MNSYRGVLKQCRFCSLQASLAEMLEHMVLNCEDDEKKVTNEDIEEEGEISGLVKCQVCACEEVKKLHFGIQNEFL